MALDHAMTTADARLDDELELSDYLRILSRRWIWIALSTTLVVALAAILTLSQEPRYSATAKVSLGSSAAQEAIEGSFFANAPTASRELSNEVNLALGDTVRLEVASQLGYEPDMVVSAEDESDALRFTASATTAETAAVGANTWAQVYVDSKRRDAAASIDEAIDAFQADLADLRAERQEIRSPIDEAEDELATTGSDEDRQLAQAKLDRLKADLEAELTLVDARLQAVTQNITNLELNSRLAATGTAQIVQVAAPPIESSNGTLARNLTLAVIVGLIVGAAAALLAENLDRTIKVADDLVSLGLPVLGEIPAPDRNLPLSELPLATMRYNGSPVAEAYQKVRTAVEFALLGREINSLLITSPNQEEGKTTLSTNLAWAMSAVDHRVALVDVDFRRPRIHEVYGCEAEPGLSDSLLSGAPLSEVALRVDEHRSGNFIVLPTGTQPPSPADFVASPGFSAQIKAIEAEADLVILDAPPVLPVSDALSLGRQVDAVILVVRAGETTRDQVATTLHSLRQVGADVIGACLVGVKAAPSYGHYAYDREPALQLGRRPWFRQRPIVDIREPAEAEVTLLISPNHRPLPQAPPPFD